MTIQTKRQTKSGKSMATEKKMIYPLSITQRQFWLIHQLVPDSPAYNIPYGFRIQGNLDIAALEISLNKIVQRHEIFRTTFDTVNGEPMQVVAKEATADFTNEDLRNLPKSKIEKKVIEKAEV